MGYFNKILIVLLMVAFSVGSCVSDKKAPIDFKPRMSDETLVEVLTDKHLVITANRMSEIRSDSILSVLLPVMEEEIYKKYGVTKEELDETLSYYAHYPEQLILIYDQIMERVEAMTPNKKTILKTKEEEK